MSMLQAAVGLSEAGFNVLPAAARGKSPIVEWTRYQNERTDAKLVPWFSGASQHNLWIATGHISRLLVLDLDNPAAEAYWRQRIAAELDATAMVLTSVKDVASGWRGRHYYFRLEAADRVASWSEHKGVSFDVRAEGTGVVAPPSVHETGAVYEWVRDASSMVSAPAVLLRREAPGSGSTPVRSMLSGLLANPPEGDGSGRNDWLARVAGHYAKMHSRMPDLYRQLTADAAAKLTPPLPDKEVAKLLDSIWAGEHARHPDRDGAEISDATGWLTPGDGALLCQTRSKDSDGNWTTELTRWADFDLRCTGATDDGANRTYSVVLIRGEKGDQVDALLPSAVLSDSRGLAAWLAGYGLTVLPPDAMWPRTGSPSQRLGRYIESQKPPAFGVAPALGWDSAAGGFLTLDGVIRADGAHGFGTVKPDPRLAGWSPYRYGLSEPAAARQVLRTVLTFHDRTVCAVFGAWWAACLLKPQIHRLSSIFPFMALEAASESGKTNGFFALMLALNGHTAGQVAPTVAALRDYVSANRSGIVWVDDLDEAEKVHELLRQSTSLGSVAKKGEDRTTQARVQLVAPICLSGENLGLSGQKALLDRSVLLTVPSPTDRRSLADPDRRQWLDILEFGAANPDLTAHAGTLVQLALQSESLVSELPGLIPASAGGRWGDKMAILRLGARVLDAITESDEDWSSLVDSWVAAQADSGAENALTLELIPAALARLNWPSQPQPADGRWPATPVLVDPDGIVWFNVRNLADWWSEIRHGRVRDRTETRDALGQQAAALDIPTFDEASRSLRAGSARVRYRPLSKVLSAAVLARSRGTVAAGTGGVPGSRGLRLSQEQVSLFGGQGS